MLQPRCADTGAVLAVLEKLHSDVHVKGKQLPEAPRRQGQQGAEVQEGERGQQEEEAEGYVRLPHAAGRFVINDGLRAVLMRGDVDVLAGVLRWGEMLPKR